MGVCKSSNPLHISHIAWFVTTRCGANPPEFGPILALSPRSNLYPELRPTLRLNPRLEPWSAPRPVPRAASVPGQVAAIASLRFCRVRMLCAATARSLARERPRSSRAHHLVAALAGVRMMPCAAPARSSGRRQRPLRDVNVSYEYAPMGTATRRRMGVRRRNYYTIPQRACKTRMRGTV